MQATILCDSIQKEKKHADPQHIDNDAALNGDAALAYCDGTLKSVTDRITQEAPCGKDAAFRYCDGTLQSVTE